MPHWYGIQSAGTPEGWDELVDDSEAWEQRVCDTITRNGGSQCRVSKLEPDPDEFPGSRKNKLVRAFFEDKASAKKAFKAIDAWEWGRWYEDAREEAEGAETGA